jgi:hypothetical protein
MPGLFKKPVVAVYEKAFNQNNYHMSTEDNPAILSVKTTVSAPAEKARKLRRTPATALISPVSDTISNVLKKKMNSYSK